MYEQYRFKSLTLEFEPTCPSSQAGAVGLYLDYDPDDSEVTNLAQLMEAESAYFGPVWLAARIWLDSAASKQWFYTSQSTTNGAAAVDRQQNPADLYVVVDKVGGSVPLGYIVAKYEVEFRHPKPAGATLLSWFNPTGPLLGAAATYTPLYNSVNINNASYCRGFTSDSLYASNDASPDNLLSWTPNISRATTMLISASIQCSAISGTANFYINKGPWGTPTQLLTFTVTSTAGTGNSVYTTINPGDTIWMAFTSGTSANVSTITVSIAVCNTQNFGASKLLTEEKSLPPRGESLSAADYTANPPAVPDGYGRVMVTFLDEALSARPIEDRITTIERLLAERASDRHIITISDDDFSVAQGARAPNSRRSTSATPAPR